LLPLLLLPLWLLSASHVVVAQEPECGVYMAESTLGVANLGIYTGMDLTNGDVIHFPEIVVPLLFRDWHHHGNSLDGTLWDRYIWEGAVVNLEPIKNLLDTDSSKAGFIPGVGCTINSRLDLCNIESTHGSTYDTAGLHRSRHVGAGAFSPYHGSKTVATRDIPAGSEIFAEYGAEWIPEIPGAVVTFDENMDEADELLENYVEWFHRNKEKLSNELVEGLWNFTTHFPTESQVLDNLPTKQPWSVVLEAMEKKQEDESVVRNFLRNEGIRDLEWLKQNGRCQDHIYPALSTIPQAGRGAFATRNLPKGTIVGYSPLIHMGNNRQLWDIKYKDTENKRKTLYVQQDLILNYSFGNKYSTLLLTPYGAMVNFINHSKEKANVKIQWPALESEAHKPDWLKKDLDSLIHTVEKIGLSFEYVALRDIQQDEEVFMDYGDEWQAAWDHHVRNWVPPPNAENYTHSTEWKGPLLTPAEQKETPYPPNLVTVCKESYSFDRKTGEYSWTPMLINTTHRVLCDVMDRKEVGDGEYKYDVKYKYDNDDVVHVMNVPFKDGIELADHLLTADWHLEHAFRHEIMIPDDMFPEQWKNQKEVRFQFPGQDKAEDEL